MFCTSAGAHPLPDWALAAADAATARTTVQSRTSAFIARRHRVSRQRAPSVETEWRGAGRSCSRLLCGRAAGAEPESDGQVTTTRATCAAKLQPGALLPAEVIQDLPKLDVTRMPKVKDTPP